MKNIVRNLSTTFFAFTLFTVSSPLAALVNPQEPAPLQKETGSSVIWTVEEGETLTGIAKAYYGDEMYWTTVWNDNPWIVNPFAIEGGFALEMRNRIPKEYQELDKERFEWIKTSEYLYTPEVQQHAAIRKQLGLPELVVVNPVVTNAVQSATAVYTGGPLSEAQITYLGQCEAGMDPKKNTGNGYYGAFQFSYGTWKSMNTGYERADHAPLEVQKDAVQRLVARSNIFGQFPGCSKKMRSLGML